MVKSGKPRRILSVVLMAIIAATSLHAQAQSDDQLLKMIPADTLFCIRINNFDYTMNQIDQFLAGASPMPMGVSMLLRMQLAQLLGSPQLSGLNTGGNFAVFGTTMPGDSTGTNMAPNIFIGILAPVTDFTQFTSGNPNCTEPDDKGISKINMNGTPVMLAKQTGNLALLSWANDYEKLITMSSMLSSAGLKSLASAIDASDAGQAMTEPIWIYGNIQLASKTFGPILLYKIDQFKLMMQSIQAAQPGGQQKNIQNVFNIYTGILKTVMDEVQSLSITITPKPDVLNIQKTVTALPGTDMAKMFSKDTSSTQQKNMSGYLEDGAMMNMLINMNSPFWKTLNIKGIDLFSTMAGENIKPEDLAKMKTLASDVTGCLGAMAASVSIDSNNKPPFTAKYVIAIKDEKKYNQVIDEAIKMMNTSGILGFYKEMGMETSFEMTKGTDNYNGVSIDSAKFTIKSTDANSPQGQMINKMYGEGFDYRWGVVNGMCVMAFGGDVNANIRKLIDQVKSGAVPQPGGEITSAMSLVPQAENADFMVTYNVPRLFKMASAFAPIPMPQVDIQSKSNIVIAGKADNGKMTVNVAIPKQHIMEIMSVVMAMQQKSSMPN